MCTIIWEEIKSVPKHYSALFLCSVPPTWPPWRSFETKTIFIFTWQCGHHDSEALCIIIISSVIKFVPSFHLHDQLFLPFIQKKEEFASELLQGETLTRHWLVPDMFAFENVGFSMTVGSIKYLACADCDRGPIGWHDIRDKTRFYIAVERVEHIEKW